MTCINEVKMTIIWKFLFSIYLQATFKGKFSEFRQLWPYRQMLLKFSRLFLSLSCLVKMRDDRAPAPHPFSNVPMDVPLWLSW